MASGRAAGAALGVALAVDRDRAPRDVVAAARSLVASRRRAGRCVLGLERLQVPLQLPLRQLDAVLVSLLALEPDVVVEDVVAERAPHQLRAGELVDRLAQRLGQRDD